MDENWKKYAIIGGIILLAGGAYWGGSYFNHRSKPKSGADQFRSGLSLDVPGRPERQSEIAGRLISLKGNLLAISKDIRPSGNPGAGRADREQRQQGMQNLTEEDRQTLRQQRQQEFRNRPIEQVTITLPEGVTVMRIQNGQAEKISAGDLTADGRIMVWTKDGGNEAEFIIENIFNPDNRQ